MNNLTSNTSRNFPESSRSELAPLAITLDTRHSRANYHQNSANYHQNSELFLPPSAASARDGAERGFNWGSVESASLGLQLQLGSNKSSNTINGSACEGMSNFTYGYGPRNSDQVQVASGSVHPQRQLERFGNHQAQFAHRNPTVGGGASMWPPGSQFHESRSSPDVMDRNQRHMGSAGFKRPRERSCEEEMLEALELARSTSSKLPFGSPLPVASQQFQAMPPSRNNTDFCPDATFHQLATSRMQSPLSRMDKQERANPDQALAMPHIQETMRMDEVTERQREAPTCTGVEDGAEEASQDQDMRGSSEEDFHLLQLLLQCAEEVASDNLEEANLIVAQLNQIASPFGGSMQRIAAYFAEALTSRLMNSCMGICLPLPGLQLIYNAHLMSAFQVFNNICPFVKFSNFTANQAILEAFEGEQSIHIIDMDIMQGLQWPALFQILASRPTGPPVLRITGLGRSMEALEATGHRLSQFACTLSLPFEFHPVVEKFGNTDSSILRVRKGDALAIHWLHHSLYDVTDSDTKTLKLLQRLQPKVVTMVEQDLSHAGSFLERFVEALHYYSALFDSLSVTLAEDSQDRHIVEQKLLSCEIRNILAVGGPARTGEVKFEQWGVHLIEAGFKRIPLSENAATQATLLLGMYGSEGYTLVEEGGTLKLGWKGTCLFTASAWTSSLTVAQNIIHQHRIMQGF
ncbi:hypothetical protein O6H91_18G054900 [Diphasiastrum complanatum]|nr:hypothetical protein O6H91_18G054900 [Diphasiastrum complanatum]